MIIIIYSLLSSDIGTCCVITYMGDSGVAGQAAWITVVMAVGRQGKSNDPLSIYIKVLFGLC